MLYDSETDGPQKGQTRIEGKRGKRRPNRAARRIAHDVQSAVHEIRRSGNNGARSASRGRPPGQSEGRLDEGTHGVWANGARPADDSMQGNGPAAVTRPAIARDYRPSATTGCAPHRTLRPSDLDRRADLGAIERRYTDKDGVEHVVRRRIGVSNVDRATRAARASKKAGEGTDR